jgi:UDP-3-O-[3-hydroxymyristoyl] glucosamine N-acyltransferase
VNDSLPPGAYVRGNPARPFVFEQRLTVLRHRLPELFQRVAALEKAVGAKPPAPEAP